MKANQIKLYYDCDTEEIVNVLYDEEVYYVIQVLKRTDDYVMYEIDQCQNATRHYSEYTGSRVLIDFNDRRNSCILGDLHLTVVNR